MPLSLATFNTKDLLDPKDDASRAHLGAKLDHLAGVLTRLDADVLGLQEVGTAAVLAALCDRLDRRGGYGEPIVGTADTRGIRNALLSRLPVLASQVHAPPRLDFPVFQAGDPPPFGDRIPMRRGVVHARVDAGELGQVEVLVAHFKSGLRVLERTRDGVLPAWSEGISARELAEAELRSLVWRASEALFVRGLVDGLAKSDARIVVLGDLNDRPGSLVVRIVMGFGPAALHACSDRVPGDRRFSAIFKGRPDLLDHILVSSALRERLVDVRILNEELRDHGQIVLAPQQEGVPPPPPPVDSDHAPVLARFEAARGSS